MKIFKLGIVSAALLCASQLVFAQKVKMAKIGLDMTEPEVRSTLGPEAHFISLSSSYAELHYLVAEIGPESFGLTFIDGRVAAFSLVHALPAGQQPFLPQGQEATGKVLRDLVAKQTWAPAKVEGADTYWVSDASGAPATDAAACRPITGEAWQSFGMIADAAEKATGGLMKPSLAAYPANCGVTIHLQEFPGTNDQDRVTSVQMQILDVKALQKFLAGHPRKSAK